MNVMKDNEPTKLQSSINTNKDFWNQLPILKQKHRISGVIPRLKENFKAKDTTLVYLCNPVTDHLATRIKDVGWGCGYRNCQMLMSFLEKQKANGEPLIKHILSIEGIQMVIEKAWKEGFDPLGATQLDHHVFKTKKWIGTTEVYTLLTYLCIRSTIIDFHHSGQDHLHNDLFNWIQSYFMESDTSKSTERDQFVFITNKPPLYLQHQGHSRTVVGIEVLKSGKRNLIMFDPGKRMPRSYKRTSKHEATDDAEESDKSMDNSTSEDTNETENRVSFGKKFITKIHQHIPHNLLRPFRVDDESIRKHEQYQILVIGHVNKENDKMTWEPEKGFLLTEEERQRMKFVTSLSVM